MLRPDVNGLNIGSLENNIQTPSTRERQSYNRYSEAIHHNNTSNDCDLESNVELSQNVLSNMASAESEPIRHVSMIRHDGYIINGNNTNNTTDDVDYSFTPRSNPVLRQDDHTTQQGRQYRFLSTTDYSNQPHQSVSLHHPSQHVNIERSVTTQEITRSHTYDQYQHIITPHQSPSSIQSHTTACMDDSMPCTPQTNVQSNKDHPMDDNASHANYESVDTYFNSTSLSLHCEDIEPVPLLPINSFSHTDDSQAHSSTSPLSPLSPLSTRYHGDIDMRQLVSVAHGSSSHQGRTHTDITVAPSQKPPLKRKLPNVNAISFNSNGGGDHYQPHNPASFQPRHMPAPSDHHSYSLLRVPFINPHLHTEYGNSSSPSPSLIEAQTIYPSSTQSHDGLNNNPLSLAVPHESSAISRHELPYQDDPYIHSFQYTGPSYPSQHSHEAITHVSTSPRVTTIDEESSNDPYAHQHLVYKNSRRPLNGSFQQSTSPPISPTLSTNIEGMRLTPASAQSHLGFSTHPPHSIPATTIGSSLPGSIPPPIRFHSNHGSSSPTASPISNQARLNNHSRSHSQSQPTTTPHNRLCYRLVNPSASSHTRLRFGNSRDIAPPTPPMQNYGGGQLMTGLPSSQSFTQPLGNFSPLPGRSSQPPRYSSASFSINYHHLSMDRYRQNTIVGPAPQHDGVHSSSPMSGHPTSIPHVPSLSSSSSSSLSTIHLDHETQNLSEQPCSPLQPGLSSHPQHRVTRNSGPIVAHPQRTRPPRSAQSSCSPVPALSASLPIEEPMTDYSRFTYDEEAQRRMKSNQQLQISILLAKCGGDFGGAITLPTDQCDASLEPVTETNDAKSSDDDQNTENDYVFYSTSLIPITYPVQAQELHTLY